MVGVGPNEWGRGVQKIILTSHNRAFFYPRVTTSAENTSIVQIRSLNSNVHI